jgi:hypothetical protein
MTGEVSAACICFPENEPPSFHWPIELEIAAKLKCPLHGDRFKPMAMIYVAEWLRKKREWFIAMRRSAQYTNLLAETMAGIHARRLDPKIGNVMAYLGTALLNALETAELERRIAALEKRTSVSEER